MPEGDTIYRAARTLNAALAGRVVTRFETALAHLARVDDDAPLAGRRVEGVTSRGKHVLMAFSGDLFLRTHMRMNGSWHVYRPGERWQAPRRDMRIVVATDAYEAVAFRVPVAEFRTAAALARDEAWTAVGPDLLAPDFEPREAVARMRGLDPQTALGDALLNQRAMSGIGNVFKSEICFAAAASPFTPLSALDDGRLLAIVGIAQRQMRANVHDPSTELVTWSGGRRTTGRADPSAALWVYGRAGAPCRRCGTPIVLDRRGDAARLTYYCPRCQQ